MNCVKSQGPSGPKGEPGAYGANNELELVNHVIRELEAALNFGGQIKAEDGCNHKRAVDGWALTQALDALRNYEALLRQPLYELISPGFYHISRQREMAEGVR